MLFGISLEERRPLGIVLALSEEGLLLCVEERWVHYRIVPLEKTNKQTTKKEK